MEYTSSNFVSNNYNVGIYAGSFNPLHEGHLECIKKASSICNKLYVILSVGYKQNEIDVLIRYRWLYQSTVDMKNVEIMILNAHGQDEDVLTVKSYIKENIDVVFCGNDYGKDSLWNKCYPESEIYYFERSGISSTLIRSNPYEYWDFIPNVVRPYYVKKVLIVGGVSTGKSTLAKLLADYFTTNYIEEAGRELSKLSGTHTKMLQDDYIEILLTHKLNEIKSIQQSNRVLFEDTDALTTLFYMNLLKNADNGKKQLAEAIALNNEFDMVLFLEPDVEFIQDGDRNLTISKERLKYSEELKEYYKRYCNVVSINGNYQERFKKAVEIVSDLINYKVTESNQEMK